MGTCIVLHFKHNVARLIGLLAVVVAASGAQAASTLGTLNVTASVADTCVVNVTHVAFGSYTGGVTDASGAVSVTCTNGTGYTVALDAGAGSGATVASRKLTHASQSDQTLSYSLYSDALHTSVWGQSTGTNTVAGTGTGAAVSHTVYGRVFSSQYPKAGSYSDTVTVTVSY